MSALEPGDLDIDISPAYYRSPRPKSKTCAEMIDELTRWLSTEVRKSRTSPDPLIAVRAMVQVRDSFVMIERSGYPQLRPMLSELQVGLDALGRLFRKLLLKRYLTRKIDGPELEKCILELAALDEPAWEQSLEEAEAEITAEFELARSA